MLPFQTVTWSPLPLEVFRLPFLKRHKKKFKLSASRMENMSVNKPRLDSVLQMIGIEGGLNFLEQSQSTTEQNQCNPGMLSKLTQIDENTLQRTITFTFQVRH